MTRDERAKARRTGWTFVAAGAAVLVVAALYWWSQWDVPPEDANSRLLLALPLVAVGLLVVGIVTLVRGRMPEEGGPR